MEPKKTQNVHARIPDPLKEDFKHAVKQLGFSEAFFVRAAVEAVIELTKSGEDLALPIRLVTVQKRRRKVKKKPGR